MQNNVDHFGHFLFMYSYLHEEFRTLIYWLKCLTPSLCLELQWMLGDACTGYSLPFINLLCTVGGVSAEEP